DCTATARRQGLRWSNSTHRRRSPAAESPNPSPHNECERDLFRKSSLRHLPLLVQARAVGQPIAPRRYARCQHFAVRVESPIAALPVLSLRPFSDLVLCPGRKIAGVMPLVQLACWIAGDPVDHAASPHGGPPGDLIGPALHVLIFVHRQEFP